MRTRLDLVQGWVEPENVHVHRLLPPGKRRVALDIGANIGVTTFLLSQRFARVHAFEPNPALAQRLAAAAISNVDVHDIALSAGPNTAKLHIPRGPKAQMTGWASLEGTVKSRFENVDEIEVQVRSLDSLELGPVDYIKIDVEGHELSVLEGAADTFAIHRPWCVIETEGDNRAKVRAYFATHTYREVPLRKLADVQGSPHNLVFLPE